MPTKEDIMTDRERLEEIEKALYRADYCHFAKWGEEPRDFEANAVWLIDTLRKYMDIYDTLCGRNLKYN